MLHRTGSVSMTRLTTIQIEIASHGSFFHPFICSPPFQSGTLCTWSVHIANKHNDVNSHQCTRTKQSRKDGKNHSNLHDASLKSLHRVMNIDEIEHNLCKFQAHNRNCIGTHIQTIFLHFYPKLKTSSFTLWHFFSHAFFLSSSFS